MRPQPAIENLSSTVQNISLPKKDSMKLLCIYLFAMFGSTTLIGFFRTDRASMGAVPPHGSASHYMFNGFPIATALIGIAVMYAAYQDKGLSILIASAVVAIVTMSCVALKIHRGYGPSLVIFSFPLAALAAWAAWAAIAL